MTLAALGFDSPSENQFVAADKPDLPDVKPFVGDLEEARRRLEARGFVPCESFQAEITSDPYIVTMG